MNSVCVCCGKYALKINRRVNKQDRERESVHVLLCFGEEGLWGKKCAFPSVFLPAVGTELTDFTVNYPLCVS